MIQGYRSARAMPGTVIVLMIVGVIAWAVVRYVRHDLPFLEPNPGKAAAWSYVFEFVAALNANDPQLLGEVAGRPPDALDIQEALRLFGGRDLADINLVMVQEFPNHYRTWITTRAGDGSVIEMYQVVGWDGERWIMGQLYTGSPPPPP